MDNELEAITGFLDSIGLHYRLAKVRDDSFMKGLDIKNGELIIDTAALKQVGDILHEAGHIAVTDSGARSRLQGDVSKCGHGPAHEMAAIAWSWAALKHIGLSPETVFHSAGYKDESQNIISAFEQSDGIGTPLLVYWQMCLQPGNSGTGFPKMHHWLRPEGSRQIN